MTASLPSPGLSDTRRDSRHSGAPQTGKQQGKAYTPDMLLRALVLCSGKTQKPEPEPGGHHTSGVSDVPFLVGDCWSLAFGVTNTVIKIT